LPQYFLAPLTAQQLFSRRSAATWFWSSSIAFSLFSFYSHRFGILVKGRPDVIVRDVPMMWRNHVSTHDLDEDMRLSVHIEDPSRIRIARVERSGDISFIKK
jgi:uncharacterized membrane protein YcaP (DUF421 family)